jgi:hypothetical protein
MGTQQTGFFEETAGVKSLMRLQSFLVLLFFFVVNLLILATQIKALSKGCELPQINDNFLWLDVIILTYAFFPKVAQKLIEAKFNVKEESSTTTATVSTTEKTITPEQ